MKMIVPVAASIGAFATEHRYNYKSRSKSDGAGHQKAASKSASAEHPGGVGDNVDADEPSRSGGLGGWKGGWVDGKERFCRNLCNSPVNALGVRAHSKGVSEGTCVLPFNSYRYFTWISMDFGGFQAKS